MQLTMSGMIEIVGAVLSGLVVYVAKERIQRVRAGVALRKIDATEAAAERDRVERSRQTVLSQWQLLHSECEKRYQESEARCARSTQALMRRISRLEDFIFPDDLRKTWEPEEDPDLAGDLENNAGGSKEPIQ